MAIVFMSALSTSIRDYFLFHQEFGGGELREDEPSWSGLVHYIHFSALALLVGLVTAVVMVVYFDSCTYRDCGAGSTDGKIHCWNTETGAKVVVLNGEHTGPVQSVQFNPKYMMLASSCTNMVS